MNDILSALTLFGAFVLMGVLVTGAIGGEYQDVDGAVAWVSSVARIA